MIDAPELVASAAGATAVEDDAAYCCDTPAEGVGIAASPSSMAGRRFLEIGRCGEARTPLSVRRCCSAVSGQRRRQTKEEEEVGIDGLKMAHRKKLSSPSLSHSLFYCGLQFSHSRRPRAFCYGDGGVRFRRSKAAQKTGTTAARLPRGDTRPGQAHGPHPMVPEPRHCLTAHTPLQRSRGMVEKHTLQRQLLHRLTGRSPVICSFCEGECVRERECGCV